MRVDNRFHTFRRLPAMRREKRRSRNCVFEHTCRLPPRVFASQWTLSVTAVTRLSFTPCLTPITPVLPPT